VGDDFNVLEPAETMLLAAHAADEQDVAFYIVAAFTGLRLGELRALRWPALRVGLEPPAGVGAADVHEPVREVQVHRRRSVPMIDQVIPALDRLSQRERFTDPRRPRVRQRDRARRRGVRATAAHVDRARRRRAQARPDPRPPPQLLHDGSRLEIGRADEQIRVTVRPGATIGVGGTARSPVP